MSEVTVVVPTIPPRASLLRDALASVYNQTHPATTVITVTDTDGKGPAVTRNTGLAAVRTEWVAFLDDDDILHPTHLERLLSTAAATGADLVYPGFQVMGGTDPLATMKDGQLVPIHGVPFGQEQAAHLRTANFIPVTVLVRTELAQAVGGYPEEWAPIEDHGFLLRLLDAGARFVHHPEVTWTWRHWGGNTSGRVWTTLRHVTDA